MFCPQCDHRNKLGAKKCEKCKTKIDYIRKRIFVGNQFVFINADTDHPVALQCDKSYQKIETLI